MLTEHDGAGPLQRLRSLSPLQLAIGAGLVGLAALVLFAPRGGGGGDRVAPSGVAESDASTAGGSTTAADTRFPILMEPRPRQPGRQAATVDGPRHPGESEGPPTL